MTGGSSNHGHRDGAPGPGPPPLPRTTLALSIIVIIVTVGSVFFCAFTTIFLDPDTKDAHKVPKAGLEPVRFTNIYDGKVTTNEGGWDLRANSVSGPLVPLAHLTIVIDRRCGAGGTTDIVFQTDGVGPGMANVSHQGAMTHWYQYSTPGRTPRYVEGGSAKDLNESTAPDLGPTSEEFKTLENTTIIVIDVDGNGYLTVNDRIYVFSDIDADGDVDIKADQCIVLKDEKDRVLVKKELP
jgi:hypothetical protein